MKLGFLPNSTQSYQYYISGNEALLYDYWLTEYLNADTKDYLQVRSNAFPLVMEYTYTNSTKINDDQLIIVAFSLDDTSTQTIRKVTTLSQGIGNVGGFYTSIITFTMLAMSLFQSKLLNLELI